MNNGKRDWGVEDGGVKSPRQREMPDSFIQFQKTQQCSVEELALFTFPFIGIIRKFQLLSGRTGKITCNGTFFLPSLHTKISPDLSKKLNYSDPSTSRLSNAPLFHFGLIKYAQLYCNQLSSSSIFCQPSHLLKVRSSALYARSRTALMRMKPCASIGT